MKEEAMDTVMADGDEQVLGTGNGQATCGRSVAHTLGALVLATSVEEGRERVQAGLKSLIVPYYDMVVEHDSNYGIDGRVRFIVYCYERDGMGVARGGGGDRGQQGWGDMGSGVKGIQEMRELVKGVSVINGKVGYICNGKPSMFKLNVSPTAKMTAKEVVRQLVVNEAVQKHTENALGAPVETLLVSAEKPCSPGRDERDIPTTLLTVSHPLVAYHLMLFSIRGLIRQQAPVHSSQLEPLPLLLEPSSDNPPSLGLEVIQNKLPGVGLYLQLLRYPRDGGRNLGERRVLEHASALIEGCRKWKKEGEDLESIGPVGVSVYVVHEDHTTDVQIRSLIYCAACRFIDFMNDPVSTDLRRVPPVGRHRLDYHSPSVLPKIYTGKEFYEQYGRSRGPVRNRARRRERERRRFDGVGVGGGGGGGGGMGGPGAYGGGGYRRGSPGPHSYQYLDHGGPGRYPPPPGDRLPKRDRPDYDDDKMDAVKRSRIDMPLQSS